MAASVTNKLEETDDTKPVSAQDGGGWPLFRVDLGQLTVVPENGSSGGPRGDWAWEISRTGVMINSSASTGTLLELGVLTKQQAALLKAGQPHWKSLDQIYTALNLNDEQILYFDEADAFFSSRSTVQGRRLPAGQNNILARSVPSNETPVIEDVPSNIQEGAANPDGNIDDAFLRRFKN